MPLSEKDQEALSDLLDRIRQTDNTPDPNDPNKELRKIALLVKHAGTVDRVIVLLNAFGAVGSFLKYVLIGVVAIIVALQALSGQLKDGLANLFSWAVK